MEGPREEAEGGAVAAGQAVASLPSTVSGPRGRELRLEMGDG